MASAPAGTGSADPQSAAFRNKRKKRDGVRASKDVVASAPGSASPASASLAPKKKHDPRFCAHADRRFLLEKLLPSTQQRLSSGAKKAVQAPVSRGKEKDGKRVKKVEAGGVDGDDPDEVKARGSRGGSGKAEANHSVRASLATSWENDERFSRIFTDDAFAKGGAIGKVDKFGRSLATEKKKKNAGEATLLKGKTKLQKGRKAIEEAEEDEEEEDKEEADEEEADEEEADEEEADEEEADEEDADEEEEEEDEEEEDEEEVDSSSESEEDAEEGPSVWEKDDDDLVMGEEASRRIAVMGLEWENVTANDLLLVFRSFARDFAAGASFGSAKKAKEETERAEAQGRRPRGTPETIVQRVAIYPSDFGLERMKIEAVKGPCIDWESVEGRRNRMQAGGESCSPDEEEQENAGSEENEEANGSQDAGEATDSEKGEDDKSEKEGDDGEATGDEAGFDGSSDDDEEMKPTEEEEILYNEALRKYQKERSRYYYAVVEFDSVASAKFFYDELDGCDISFALDGLDLRFIPDDLEFPHSPTSVSTLSAQKGEEGRLADEAALLRYEPPPAASTALRHSRVKCTWDETPMERTKMLTRRFTEKELRDLDLKEYLASSSSSEDESSGPDGRRWKLTESNLQAYRRQLLGDAADLSSDSENDASEDESEGPGASRQPASKLQISFEGELEAFGLSADEAETDRPDGITEGDEKAWEAYVHRSKKKEKEQRKREARKFEAARAAADEEDDADEDEEGQAKRTEGQQRRDRRERGKKFPLFSGAVSSDEAPSSQDEDFDGEHVESQILPRRQAKQAAVSMKSKGAKKSAEKKDDASAQSKHKKEDATKAELELLTLGHDEETRRHFDLRDELLSRPSKRKAKKMKRMREQEPEAGPTEASSFKIDVDDDRFSRLFSNPEFAIDPTNPNFKKTAATDELLRVKRMRSSKLQFAHLKAAKRAAVSGAEAAETKSKGGDAAGSRAAGEVRGALKPASLGVSQSGSEKAGKGKAAKQKGKGFTLFANNPR
ncbi:Predicted CDS Pa_6_6770, related [Neospora caninum Liverpool]|uniref:Predicted CDS Pa_6_6770, related n=1 Tax=Neospora caninum (strain Liverpool) TaxID=572307 RepID=F0VJ80_NEOCL|nr:Predicted CDS Pa_6_6770, related [Neospora caninum Liverpool]CBZ53791.1 Predicted CDS Pa_6_6770, related [Neospora caninum Liverpool]CEL67784.1 TPA: Predicted CDS Pa_6_6770, related [Neospora caninum Liverpool]|eukprot:XP_003883823.1 Predicted CDS Pa_6_6770, related [Neospora caninum Liverpool]